MKPQWEMKVPVISTAHVSPSFAKYLHWASEAKVDLVCDLFNGWLLPLSVDASLEDYSELEGFAEIWEWALREYCDDGVIAWVRFDADGDKIAELPVYEW